MTEYENKHIFKFLKTNWTQRDLHILDWYNNTLHENDWWEQGYAVAGWLFCVDE